MRINFSVAATEFLSDFMTKLQASYEIMPYPRVAVMVDTQGPEIRTGANTPETALTTGEEFLICYENDMDAVRESAAQMGGMKVISVDYPHIVSKGLRVGEKILIDDGSFGAVVKSTGENGLYCVMTAENDGMRVHRCAGVCDGWIVSMCMRSHAFSIPSLHPIPSSATPYIPSSPVAIPPHPHPLSPSDPDSPSRVLRSFILSHGD